MSDKFRLATVLKVAKIRQRQAEADAARRVREEAAAEAEATLRALAYEARAPERQAEAESWLGDRELTRLKAAAYAEADRRHAAASEAREESRQALVAQAIEVRTLERLEAQHAERMAFVASKAAERALDEVARMRRWLA